MVHGIFHAVSENKEGRLCWGIHVVTEMHAKVLNIIASLNIDVHEVNNPVVEGSPM